MREKLIELLAAMLEHLEDEDADAENVIDELTYELEYLRDDGVAVDVLCSEVQ
jgi:hypothetical protein